MALEVATHGVARLDRNPLLDARNLAIAVVREVLTLDEQRRNTRQLEPQSEAKPVSTGALRGPLENFRSTLGEAAIQSVDEASKASHDLGATLRATRERTSAERHVHGVVHQPLPDRVPGIRLQRFLERRGVAGEDLHPSRLAHNPTHLGPPTGTRRGPAADRYPSYAIGEAAVTALTSTANPGLLRDRDDQEPVSAVLGRR